MRSILSSNNSKDARVNIEINEFLSLNFVLLVTLRIKRKMMIQNLQQDLATQKI
jgi:hypothetical protein